MKDVPTSAQPGRPGWLETDMPGDPTGLSPPLCARQGSLGVALCGSRAGGLEACTSGHGSLFWLLSFPGCPELLWVHRPPGTCVPPSDAGTTTAQSVPSRRHRDSVCTPPSSLPAAL